MVTIDEDEDDIFKGCGIEVKLTSEQNFLKIKETLSRIGVASKKEKKLFQSCHILHKRGRYIITHFKEMFYLDGKETTLTNEDIMRRNTIASLLHEWNLVTILDMNEIKDFMVPLSSIKILSFQEKAEWELVAKYSIGMKHK